MSVCADAFVFIVYVVYTLLYTFIMVYILYTCHLSHLSHSPLSSLPRPPPTVLHYNILVRLIIFVCFFVIFILSGSFSLSRHFESKKTKTKKYHHDCE